MPDTFDLDQILDDFRADVARASRPRGAATAVHKARRRRGAAIGVLAAVATAGVLIGGGLLGSDDRPSPAPPVHQPTRAIDAGPDAATLRDAFDGWLSTITETAPSVDVTPRCLAFDGSPWREFSAGRGIGLATSYASYADGPTARGSYDALLKDAADCSALQQDLPVTAPAGTSARVLLLTGTEATGGQLVLVEVSGSTIGAFTLTGVQDVPPGLEHRPVTGAIAEVAAALAR